MVQLQDLLFASESQEHLSLEDLLAPNDRQRLHVFIIRLFLSLAYILRREEIWYIDGMVEGDATPLYNGTMPVDKIVISLDLSTLDAITTAIDAAF